MNATKITILGDVHQKYEEMEKLGLHNDYVVQLGDLGFNYDYIYKNYDKNKFKVCLGNHDQYDHRPTAYDLGDYGLTSLNGMEFFFVRGAWSIDIKQRQRMMMSGMSPTIWWKQEELSPKQMQDCYEEYIKTKPSVVMTHSCPSSIAEKVGNPGVWKYFGWNEPKISNTQLLLQEMFDAWQPDLWIFGHFHRDWFGFIEDTHFICVDELSFLDFDEDWRIL